MPQIKVTKQLKEDWDRWTSKRDMDACDGLVEAYTPLVEYHVQRIGVNLPKNVHLDDLRSHAMFGLYDALQKFDQSRDLKFDTYASFRIRGAIIDGLRQEDRLPRSMREKSKKIEQSIEKLEQVLGRTPTSVEVAEDTEMSEEEVLHIMNESFLANVLSIDETTPDNDREDTYASTIIDQNTLTPQQNLDRKAQIEELEEVIKQLNEKEQLVISLFYFEELSLTEIGEVLNLSTSRISQIHSKTIFKLQQQYLKQQNK
ncbi:FliA/WhiG family RNA polymerase sigma factor [Bacillus shivajii]|uniref:FliA/WhiG family RNA polymerase sigma factor n=1 Tax=Bacillus shivajii TaxID=1983719 RepID=UPI001CFAA556|nr:FliA/WhiG family RNA polymerase sigma factor [Bacillus shivajii]UCZ51701.1 FliA/WhiG family RNA polymerase sigma factor [Bacillus shivajii]